MEKEQWKPIKEFPHLYEISTTGALRNRNTGKIRKQTMDAEGYIRYTLSASNKSYRRYGHRLVAEVFIENTKPDKWKLVHHKNNIRDDNRMENLEWCDQKYNRNRAFVSCPCCGTKIKV